MGSQSPSAFAEGLFLFALLNTFVGFLVSHTSTPPPFLHKRSF